MTVTRLLSLLALMLSTSTGVAEITTEAIPYTHDEVDLEGYLAIPEGEPRGAVLVVHEWWGLNDYAKRRANMLADLGYVAFAVDMYGKGKVTDRAEQAGQWATALMSDRELYHARAMAGLEAFKATGQIKKSLKTAAIGYCFGGSTVIEMAYAGADLAGVVSFHGNPNPPLDSDTITASILLCHGDGDFLVPDATLDAATDALDAKGADWLLIRYARAEHAFSNPAADGYGIKGVSYHEKADRRAWAHMQAFLDEVLRSE